MRLARIILSLVAIGVAISIAVLPVSAATYGGGNVQGYDADRPIDNGTIVELTGENADRVKVATKSDLQNMFGVTVDRNQLSVTLSNSALQNETFVAVSGTYNTLVSTEGGDIKPGDYVTLSSLDGIAMKADTEVKTVFGRAGKAFDGSGVTLSTTTLKDTSGKTSKSVKIGMIPVTVDIKRNPNIISTEANLPEMLQRIGQQIAEKPVNPIRVYLSLAIAVVSLIAAIVVLYAGVRNGVISIGRNPMSKKLIFRAMLQIVLTSALILTIGLFAVYLLLKL